LARKKGNYRVRRFRQFCYFACALAISVAAMGAERDPGPIRAEPKSLERTTRHGACSSSFSKRNKEKAEQHRILFPLVQ